MDDLELRDVILTRIWELEEVRVMRLEETLKEERLLRNAMQESEWALRRKQKSNRLLAINKRKVAESQRLHDRG